MTSKAVIKAMIKKRQELKENLSDFSALYNMEKGGGLIKYYEGIEAVKNVHDEILDEMRPGDDYSVISDSKKWMELYV